MRRAVIGGRNHSDMFLHFSLVFTRVLVRDGLLSTHPPTPVLERQANKKCLSETSARECCLSVGGLGLDFNPKQLVQVLT